MNNKWGVDTSYEHKTGCPRCIRKGRDSSKDNLHVYGEGKGAYCWSCEFTIPSDEWLEENGEEIEEEYEDLMGKPFDDSVNDAIKKRTGINTKGYRGIRTDTSKIFGVRFEYDEATGDVATTYFPCTTAGDLSGYKVREHPKTFAVPYGETGKECDMFGQFKFKTQNNMVLIVGGEFDQLAAYQMLSDSQKNKQYDPVAVVSSTIGESGAYRQVTANYQFFERFKKIIVCMDSDSAGKEAAQKLAEVLPQGKVYVMDMRYKDPNKYLEDGKQSEFISDFWGAKPYVPDGVKSGMDAFDEVAEEVTKERIPLPDYMKTMQDMMGGGIIQGRIFNVIADTSSGKSTHLNRMVYHWIFNSPVTPTIVSLEATAPQYVMELLSVHLKRNLMWELSGEEIVEFLRTEEGIKARNELCFREDGSPRFYIIDERSGNIKNLEQQMEMLYKKHGSKLFIIDVLTDALRGSSEQYAEDHMNFQKNLIKNGVTIGNVLHTRKPPQTQDGKPRKVTEYDALGTGSFVQSAAYNIVLNRDKLAEDLRVRNTTEVELPKCRGGKTGPAGFWYYDFQTVQCHAVE